jgi:tetratricopeptide (TPR) repeat protein
MPVVLVVDYAETREALPVMLAAAAHDVGGPNLRILLLARSTGEWWQQLQDKSPYEVSELIAAFKPITLGPVTDAASQQDVFAEALSAFAGLREISCPPAHPRLAGQSAVVLVVHAAALLAVLDAEVATTSVSMRQSSDDVLSRLLSHERRYWQQSLSSRLAVPLDPDVTERVVAVGCLVGAPDQESALQLLTAIPDLADEQLRGTVARWLHDLYPPTDGAAEQEWIGQLRPDLIAERLVVTVLDKHPELVSRLFASLDESRATRALTVLARAALTQPSAISQIRQVLEADADRLIIPALAVTTATNRALASVIINVFESGAIPADRLEAIAQAIPHHSVALAEVGVVVTSALATSAEIAADRARWLHFLSAWLSDLWRWKEALAAIEEAVSINRELARANPDAFRPELASSLNGRWDVLSKLGRQEEALAAIEEAVAIYRELARANPESFLHILAGLLSNYAKGLSELGRLEEALAAIEEAVSINRELARTNPNAFRHDLASLLDNRAAALSKLRRHEQALAVSEEAVSINRELARTNPDAFRPYLAGSLSVRSAKLAKLEQWEEALPAIEEAVAIYRELAPANPDTLRSRLAESLNNFAAMLTELGRREEALAAIEEAVAIYRELARARPDDFRPHLAGSLSNYARTLAELGQWKEALPAIKETVSAYRKLARARPDDFRSSLATSLNNLSAVLSSLGRTREASAAQAEARGIASHRGQHSG